jgi:hypothetical protein
MKWVYVGQLLILFPGIVWYSCDAFHLSSKSIHKAIAWHGAAGRSPSIVLNDSIFPDETDEVDDDDDVEPGKMRVAEIKAELYLRNVSYADCFDKESLAQRLRNARKEGVADPSILDKFNKQNLEGIFNGESVNTVMKNMKDSDIEAAIANDGTIPGGLTPDDFKKLIGNPEVIAYLSSTKVQDAMKLIMTGNQRELEKQMEKDSELRGIVEKLDSTLKSIGLA